MTDRVVPGTAGELSAVLLDGTASFSLTWLHAVNGIVVPLASPARIDRTLAEVLRIGADAVDVRMAMAARIGEDHADDELVWVSLVDQAALTEATWQDVDFAVALPDFSAALLVTTHGYALLGGSPAFVRGAVNGGVDDARARFGRYAKRIGGASRAIAARYPPLQRPWGSVREVESGSAVAEQLALMTALVAGEISAPTFAPRWRDAWRRQRDTGERTRGTLGDVLSEVLSALEDYAADPSLRELGDLTDEELVAVVRRAVDLLKP